MEMNDKNVMPVPAVSVIVPVYNVARYIAKCARSLFEQTLENLEIIFIDDCSPDNSTDIIKSLLEEYPSRKTLTKIIRMPHNSGQAEVRKRGIEESTAEYIIHCDGDDWVDNDLYEKMYVKALKTSSDVIFCPYIHETTKGPLYKDNITEAISGKDLVKNWYSHSVNMACWNKLVKRSIFVDNDIYPWEGLNMWEDNGLLTRALYFASSLNRIDGSFYHYNRLNVGAITYHYGRRETNQMIEIAKNLDIFFSDKEDSKDFKNTANAFKYLAKLNLITDSFKNYKEYKSLFKESNYIKKFIPNTAFSKRGLFRFKMVKYGFAPIFILMFKTKNILFKKLNFK